jgi:hypothetical protein
MSEPTIFNVIYIAYSILWTFISLAAVGISFFRFRATASGILIGIPMLLLAFKSLLMLVLNRTFLSYASIGYETHVIIQALSFFIGAMLFLVVGAGIALIPRSLSRLAR